MRCLSDLDGTLIDSEPGITACIRHALTKLGVPAPADLRPWIGPPLRHSFGRMGLIPHQPGVGAGAPNAPAGAQLPDHARQLDLRP